MVGTAQLGATDRYGEKVSLASQIESPPNLFGFGERVVHRVWRVVPSPGRRHTIPLLAGLGGFLWRDRRQQAHCDAGALHRAVPDPWCTCGIYGRVDSADPHRLPLPSSRPLVSGFVALSGRVIERDGIVRASDAEIVGPLRLLGPRRPWWMRRTVASRVITLPGDYLVSWGRSTRDFDEWARRAATQLADRYSVEVI